MKRFSLAFAIVALSVLGVCCSSSSSQPSGTSCTALGGDSTCTGCLSAHCSSSASAASSDCSSIMSCYCGCGLAAVCCVETCSPPAACLNDTKALGACAAENCATECAVSPVGLCAGEAPDGGT